MWLFVLRHRVLRGRASASVSLQVASESEHCITKREQEKCMEKITLHNPSDNLELGKRWCVTGGFYANVNTIPNVSKSSAASCSCVW